jgi:hypothetical protein
MLHSNCHAIQIACVEDLRNDLTFAIHATSLIKGEYGGQPQMPPLLWNLLTHPAVILCNVSQFNDIASVINSFLNGEVPKFQIC